MTEKWQNICRLCLAGDTSLKNMFQKHKNIYVADVLKKYIGVEIYKDDLLPSNICGTCISSVSTIHENLKLFKENDNKLRKVLSENIKTESIVKVEVDCLLNNLQESGKPDGPTLEDPLSDEDEEDDKNKDSDFEFGSDHNESEEEEVVSDTPDTEEDDEEEEEEKPPPKKKVKQKQPPGEKKKRIRKPLPDNFPRLNDNKCYVCMEKCGSKQLLAEHLTAHLDKIPFNCDKCVMEKVVIKTLSTLNLHLKMHAQPAKCEYCDKSYSNEKNKNLHINYYHLSPKETIECKLCLKVCPSQKSYEIHMKAHNNEHQCQICKKACGNKGVLKEHLLSHSDKRDYECSTCGNKFKTIQTYSRHVMRHTNEKPFECHICPAKFFFNVNLKNHMKLHEKNIEIKPNRDYSQYYTIKIDEKTNERIFECNFCQKAKKRSLIRGHMLMHLKPHKCTYCEKKFNSDRTRIDHENTHTGSKPYICEVCGKAYTFVYKLRKHNKIHFPGKFHCEFCGDSFLKEAGLTLHMRSIHKK